jgi:hypothetical protein
MNAAVLSVLDRSLQYSLWGFLLAFLALLLFLSYQMRSRKLSVGELYEEESGKWPRRRRISTNAQIRVAARALTVSLLAGLLLFAAFTFVPLPGIDNFASGTAWQIPPLRVTALNYESLLWCGSGELMISFWMNFRPKSHLTLWPPEARQRLRSSIGKTPRLSRAISSLS